MLNLFKVYELTNLPRNPIDNFTLKIICLVQLN